jgi:hypothetical protein
VTEVTESLVLTDRIPVVENAHFYRGLRIGGFDLGGPVDSQSLQPWSNVLLQANENGAPMHSAL